MPDKKVYTVEFRVNADVVPFQFWGWVKPGDTFRKNPSRKEKSKR